MCAVYSSPMLRARQSASIAARASGLPIRGFSAGLIEVRTSYQGQPNSILKPSFSFYHPKAAEDDETMEEVSTA